MFVKSVKFVIASFLVAGSLSNAIADSANDEKMKKAALKAGCLACHSPHSAASKGLLATEPGALCVTCHASTRDAAVRGPYLHSGRASSTGLVSLRDVRVT